MTYCGTCYQSFCLSVTCLSLRFSHSTIFFICVIYESHRGKSGCLEMWNLDSPRPLLLYYLVRVTLDNNNGKWKGRYFVNSKEGYLKKNKGVLAFQRLDHNLCLTFMDNDLCLIYTNYEEILECLHIWIKDAFKSGISTFVNLNVSLWLLKWG